MAACTTAERGSVTDLGCPLDVLGTVTGLCVIASRPYTDGCLRNIVRATARLHHVPLDWTGVAGTENFSDGQRKRYYQLRVMILERMAVVEVSAEPLLGGRLCHRSKRVGYPSFVWRTTRFSMPTYLPAGEPSLSGGLGV